MTKKINFTNIINPWDSNKKKSGVPGSKLATMSRYRLALFFPIFPRLEIKRKKDIIVMGTGLYKKLDPELRKHTHVVISAKDILRDFNILFSLIRSFTFDLNIYSKIYKQIYKKSKGAQFLNVKKSLQKINPKLLILKSTIDPINSVWAFWARKLNIKVVCIQHGIFSSKSDPAVLERDIVDFYFTLGAKQSEMISSVIPKKKHINLYDQENYSCNFENKKNISICFIGSDHERYSAAGIKNKEKVLNIYIKVIDYLQKEKDVEYKFYYKMHPSETRNNNKILPLVQIIDESEYSKVDIFFGIASSLIVKLASLHKFAIQLRSKNLPLDDYEELGYCGSIDIDEIKRRGLNSILKKNKVFPCVKEKEISSILRSMKLL